MPKLTMKKPAPAKNGKGKARAKAPRAPVVTRAQVISTLSRPELPRIVLLVAVAVVVYFGVLGTRGNLNDASEVAEQTAQVEQQNVAARADVEALRKQQASQGSSGVARTLSVSLPQRVDWDRQYEIISGLAQAAGTSLLEFTPNDTSGDAASSYRAIPVNLKLRCNFETCLRFISGLQGLSTLRGDRIITQGPVWAVDSLAVPLDSKTIDFSMTATLHAAGNALLTGAVPAETAAGGTTPTTPETP